MTLQAAARPKRSITLIADDYGIAPGVDGAIRRLIAERRLEGTSCMTLFPEWTVAADRLRPVSEDNDEASIGLHLTLTDFEPLSGERPLDLPSLPSVGQLIKASYLGKIDEGAVFAELDAQLDAFRDGFGRDPDHIDGHQHVHFLPVARRWLESRLGGRAGDGKADERPWLRGAPALSLAPGVAILAKTGVVALLAIGFDRRMQARGFRIKGPLTGFYDWRDPSAFTGSLRRLIQRGPDDMVVMCHPGAADEILIQRDELVAARESEYSALLSADAAFFDQLHSG